MRGVGLKMLPASSYDASQGDIMSDLLTDYQRDGFVHLRGLFTAEEVAAMQTECDRLLALDLVDPNNGRTPFRFGSTECPERIDPVVDISELFKRLVADQRLLNVEEFLTDQPVLFKDKLILKRLVSMAIKCTGLGPELTGFVPMIFYPYQFKLMVRVLPMVVLNCFGLHDNLMTPPGVRTNFVIKN